MCEGCKNAIREVAQSTGHPVDVVAEIYNAITEQRRREVEGIDAADIDSEEMLEAVFQSIVNPDQISGSDRPLGADPYILLRVLPLNGVTETLAVEVAGLDDAQKVTVMRAALVTMTNGGNTVLDDGTIIGDVTSERPKFRNQS